MFQWRWDIFKIYERIRNFVALTYAAFKNMTLAFWELINIWGGTVFDDLVPDYILIVYTYNRFYLQPCDMDVMYLHVMVLPSMATEAAGVRWWWIVVGAFYNPGTKTTIWVLCSYPVNIYHIQVYSTLQYSTYTHTISVRRIF